MSKPLTRPLCDGRIPAQHALTAPSLVSSPARASAREVDRVPLRRHHMSSEKPAHPALLALQAAATSGCIRQTTPPTLDLTPPTYVASTTYDFPDGGRFRVSLSGPPLSLFVTGESGLPDGFLMEINNYIFSTLLTDPPPAPHPAVATLLTRAHALFQKSSNKLDDVAVADIKMESSRIATAALMKQLSLLEGLDTRTDGFVTRPKDDNLYIWTLNLYFDAPLQQSLQELGYDSLQLELRFPSDYPYAPPFVRIVAPCIRCRYVLPRGGICMQLFSASGWTPANSIDAVCVQVRAMLLAGGLQVVDKPVWKYTYDGAKTDLQNAVRQHRWDEIDTNDSKRKKIKY